MSSAGRSGHVELHQFRVARSAAAWRDVGREIISGMEDAAVTFKIRGQTFECARTFDDLPPAAVADLLLAGGRPRPQPAAGLHHAVEDFLVAVASRHDLSPDELVAVGAFLEAAVVDKARWRAVISSKTDVIGVGDLVEVFRWLLAVYSDRELRSGGGEDAD